MARFFNLEKGQNKSKNYSNPERMLTDSDDIELIKRFRFNKNGINFICQLVNDDLKRSDNRGNPVPIELQVLITLKYLASGNFQIDVADRFNVSQKTASNIIQRVTHSISSNAGQFIKFPSDHREIASIKNGFYEPSNFPTAIGAIDCTHIKLLGLPNRDEGAYVNRKNFHSLNVQAVVDCFYRFLHVDCSWPGSTHDSFILRQSQIWGYFENNDRGLLSDSVLLGDSGYPLRDWLMVPYLRPNNESQIRFNLSHARARVKVEQTFGQLKRRFFANVIGYRVDLGRVPACIISSFVLHNIAKHLKMPEIFDEGEQNQPIVDDQPDPEFEPDDLDNDQNENAGGINARGFANERQKKLAGIKKREEITQNRFSDLYYIFFLNSNFNQFILFLTIKVGWHFYPQKKNRVTGNLTRSLGLANGESGNIHLLRIYPQLGVRLPG